MDNVAEAKKLFAAYFKTCWKAAGMKWTGDNQSEVETAIDCLVDAVLYESRMTTLDEIAKIQRGD